MTILGERTFTPDDQLGFAALSGDFNPLHVDAVAARRTVFGAPVVHGLHLLCWAMDRWAAEAARPPCALKRVRANFGRGVLVGDAILASLSKSDSAGVILQIQRDQSEMALIRAEFGPPVTYAEALPPMSRSECRALSASEIERASGSLPLSYAPADAARLFPHLTALLPPYQLAALLASTRLVGMECPGLHSIYSGLDLTFSDEPTGEPALKYHVPRSVSFGAVRLAVDGPGLQGELRAFLRPVPRAQTPARELQGLVEKDSFAGQNALVVGGSRGLGEVTAKLLAMGGAEVIITYHRGKADAEAVAAEINSAGGKCAIAQLDSTHPAPIELPHPPTHLYYFATPHIVAEKAVFFSPERFAEYCRFYVSGFSQTLLAVAQGLSQLDVLYPSTIFLDDPPDHMAVYCAAKAAGEELCRQLVKRFPGWRISAPRLPRMHTDQNNGLLPGKMEAPDVVLLRYLLEMKHGVRMDVAG